MDELRRLREIRDLAYAAHAAAPTVDTLLAKVEASNAVANHVEYLRSQD